MLRGNNVDIFLKQNRVETEEDIFIYEFEKLDSWNDVAVIRITDNETVMFKDDGSSHTPTKEDLEVIERIIADWHKRFDGGAVDRKKSLKMFEVSQKAQEFENNVNKSMYFISSVGGYRINGDRRTRSNIQDLITYNPTDTVKYRDYDNVERELTKSELETILKEHVMNGQNLYNQKWDYEAQINACTTVEEVKAIEINFEMTDFSKE